MPDIEGLQGKDLWDKLATVNEDGEIEDPKGAAIDYVKQAALDQKADATATQQALSEKAGLDGGADANFAAMPWVGGDEIMEEGGTLGATSGGKWVAFANGTLIQRMFRVSTRLDQMVSGEIVSYTESWPIAFVGEAPVVSIDHTFRFTEHESRIRVVHRMDSLFNDESEYITNEDPLLNCKVDLYVPGTPPGVSQRTFISITGIGRWK